MTATDAVATGRRLFDDLAEERCATEPAITHAVMMGFPCLRVAGVYAASFDPRSGDLVVKLSEARARELVAAGEGEPFRPNRHAMRQWVAITTRDEPRWRELLAEAEAYARSDTRA